MSAGGGVGSCGRRAADCRDQSLGLGKGRREGGRGVCVGSGGPALFAAAVTRKIRAHNGKDSRPYHDEQTSGVTPFPPRGNWDLCCVEGAGGRERRRPGPDPVACATRPWG